eukprot:CAMPEP_0180469676 /NCGR_PEP_ID=MMETSP1036_2-20121128/28186_1 /TAXON_ID=632150 /ORGANISM="Azadinium spinosum, Strain 3D9" /LENGTH=57 /DNA_ID=CAMNT_0022476773 /DNA_START=105 /DNA_END=275 /DNA_ORIENTATION=-
MALRPRKGVGSGAGQLHKPTEATRSPSVSKNRVRRGRHPYGQVWAGYIIMAACPAKQ